MYLLCTVKYSTVRHDRFHDGLFSKASGARSLPPSRGGRFSMVLDGSRWFSMLSPPDGRV